MGSTQQSDLFEFVKNTNEINIQRYDEFDGTEVDLSKWSFEIGDGCDIVPTYCGAWDSTAPNRCQWGNNEKQWYTDRPKNVRVENGSLIITDRKLVAIRCFYRDTDLVIHGSRADEAES